MKYFLTVIMGALLFWSCSDDNKTTTEEVATETYSVSGLSASAVTFAAEGGSETVSFTTTNTWTASASESWCTVAATSGAAGTNAITITAAENTSTDERNASVTITCGTATAKVTVTQKYAGALTVTSNKVEIGCEGGEATITATYTDALSYEIESTAQSWISVATRATSSSTLTITVAENTAKNTRQGQILVTNGTLSETVTVYQEGITPELVLSNNSYTVASAGETIAVELKSNVEFTVVMPEVDWISANTTRASSTYTLYYTIAENTTYEQRSATISYVNTENSLSESVTITQVQNDAIIVAAETYELDYNAQALDFNVNTNVDFTTTVGVNWITAVSSRGLISKALCFDVAENTTESSRTGVITFTYGTISQTVTVTQGVNTTQEEVDQLTLERQMLVKLYESTNGGSWKYNTNWCSDEAVSSWYGITCDDEGYVTQIALSSNTLTGTLPDDLGGTFERIELFKVSSNKITGSIPAWWADYMHLGRSSLGLCYNYLEGEIPAACTSHDNLKMHWVDMFVQRDGYYISTDATIPGPDFVVTDLNGIELNSDTIYDSSPYVILSCLDHAKSADQYVFKNVSAYYETYQEFGLEAIAFTRSTSSTTSTSETLASYLSENGYGQHAFWWETGTNYIEAFYTGQVRRPMTVVVGPDRNVVWHHIDNVNNYYEFLSYIDGWMEDYATYGTSTDFSADGEVITLQTATEGAGINLVMLGDGFIDTDHVSSDGNDDTYLAWMKEGVEEIFRLEPMKSFRNYFNIYTVRVVSLNNSFTASDAEVAIGKSDTKAFAYANKVDGMSIPGVAVLYNTKTKCGTSVTYSYTDGSFTVYLMRPVGVVLTHEVVGHGYGRLADEYVSTSKTETNISDDSRYKYLTTTWYLTNWWYRNIDITNDASSIKWAHFLSNSAYYGVEDLGIYEGGFTCGLGAYRPSEDSMMSSNQEFWNVPGREAIYYKVKERALSASGWTYSLNDFLTFDQGIDYGYETASGPTRSSVNSTSWECEEEPEQVIQGSWKNALK